MAKKTAETKKPEVKKEMPKVEKKEEKKEETQIAVTPSKRFSDMVVTEFSDGFGNIEVTEFQKKLIQGYFVGVDIAIKEAEAKRKINNKTKDNPVICWSNVKMENLVKSIVAHTSVGLDMTQHAHIYAVLFYDFKIKKYDVNLLIGYKGASLIKIKYGLHVPDHIIVELVYNSDHFKPIKKSINNQIENYEFDIVDAFSRTEDNLKGAFYYHIFDDSPERNKLVIVTLDDIEKRKPKSQNISFYGGEKTVWKDNKPTDEKEVVIGWKAEMYYKTVYKMAYSKITIDSMLIDDSYRMIKEQEAKHVNSSGIQEEIKEKGNKTKLAMPTIEVKPSEVKEEEKSSTDGTLKFPEAND